MILNKMTWNDVESKDINSHQIKSNEKEWESYEIKSKSNHIIWNQIKSNEFK